VAKSVPPTRLMTAAPLGLGAGAFEAEYAAGRAMRFEEILALAVGSQA
jgi:hypothetical protein